MAGCNGCGDGGGIGRRVEESMTSRYSEWIVEVLDDLPSSFLITDPSIPGHPIVFASRGFLEMSGYERDEVVGRNGRIFQGPGTCRRSVMRIREAIREERALQIRLLNYRRDRTPHWILFHMCPVFGVDDGRVVHFVAVEVPIRRKRRACGGQAHLLGTCRNELLMNMDQGCGYLALDSVIDENEQDLGTEESFEVSDEEKQKAASSANCVLSALARYSKVMGRAVCAKRDKPAPLSSSLNILLGRIKQSFVLTDPQLPDMPIVYASDAFLSLTGYSRNEILGQNCRFLNGPDTDMQVLKQLKACIQAEQPCTVYLLNYRKDGSTFWNRLHVSPVRNASGKIAFYVGVQIDVDSKSEVPGLSMEMRQLGTVGAVKVAVRGLSTATGGEGPSSSSS